MTHEFKPGEVVWSFEIWRDTGCGWCKLKHRDYQFVNQEIKDYPLLAEPLQNKNKKYYLYTRDGFFNKAFKNRSLNRYWPINGIDDPKPTEEIEMFKKIKHKMVCLLRR